MSTKNKDKTKKRKSKNKNCPKCPQHQISPETISRTGTIPLQNPDGAGCIQNGLTDKNNREDISPPNTVLGCPLLAQGSDRTSTCGPENAGPLDGVYSGSERGSSINSTLLHSWDTSFQVNTVKSTRKAAAALDYVKLRKVEHWVATGDYGINSEPEALGLQEHSHPQFVNQANLKYVEDSQISGHVKLATFLVNFTSAYVVPINFAGCSNTALIDCGASKTLATSSYVEKCIGTQYNAQLAKYTGPQFHAASGEPLCTEGVLHCTLQCGPLIWQEAIIVYTARHSELLFGHNILTKFSLLIAPNALYIPLQVLNSHMESNNCCRLGTWATPILVLQVDQKMTIAPMQSASVPCFVSKSHYSEDTLQSLSQYSWVAHTEDFQDSTNPKDLNVYYQLIEFKDSKTEINYTNTTQEYIYLEVGEEICHAEQMECLAQSLIHHNDDALMRCLYHTFYLPKEANSVPSASELFLHEEVNQPTSIDFETINCTNDGGMREFLIDFCKTIPAAFSTSKYDIGMTTDSEIMHFSVVTDATPQNCKPIPTSPALLDRANDMIKNLIARGLVTYSPPNNCWKAAMFFVLKKPSPDQLAEMQIASSGNPGNPGNPRNPGKKPSIDKSKLPLRAICDYRFLNRKLKKRYPVHSLPSLRSIMDRLVHKRYIAAIDLRQSFWHCRLSPAAQLLTGFDFNGQHYLATRLPHGITFCSQAFQSMLCRLLRKANLEHAVYPFVDDLIIGSASAEEHKIVVTKLITALHGAGLKINFQKSAFASTTRIVLFGWELNIPQSAIRACPSKIAQVQSMCPPRTTRQARRFVGQFTHYNQAIPRIAAVLGPIFQLCSDRTPFKWSQDCQSAFEEALRLLGLAECLILPDFQAPFYLSSDAAKGQAASFSVWQRNKTTKLLQPIKHGSFMFKKAAKLYSQYKAEAMAICHGLQSSMIYFQFGTNFLITDVAAIQWIVKYRHAAQQIYAWSLLLCSLDLQIIAVHNQSSVIQFNDAFCRPQEAKDKLQKQITYNDKKPYDLPLIDFGGLMHMPIQNLITVIEKFQSFLTCKSAPNIKEKWKQFAAKETDFIQRAIMYIPLEHGLAFQEPQELDWHFVSKIANPIGQSGTKGKQFAKVEQLLINHFPEMALEQLIYYQSKDTLCKRFLNNPKKPFYLINRVLFKLINDKYLLVWPSELTYNLVKAFHEHSKVYHLRRKKLLAELRQSFYIQSYRLAFDQVIADCAFCNLHSKGKHPQIVPLGMTIELSTPCQMWNIDYLNINSSFKNFPAILTLTDPFSAYTLFIPANDSWNDTRMIQALLSAFLHTGMPQALGSDNQASLISSRVNVWAKIMGIKLFQCALPTANVAEKRHQACLTMFSVMNRQMPLSDELMPAYSFLATLIFNSIPTEPSGKSPHHLIFNGGPFLPNIGKLAPIYGKICSENIDEFNYRFAKMKMIFHQIKRLQMERNEKKLGALKKFQNTLAKGDLVLLVRKSHGVTRIQHKLRAKTYKTPFVVKKILQKSCVLVPYLPEKLKKNKLKRHGKYFQSPELIVPLNRCKIIKNPLPYLDLGISEQNLLKMAELFRPKPMGICRVILSLPEQKQQKLPIQDFFHLLTTPGLYFSPFQRTCIVQNIKNYKRLLQLKEKPSLNPFDKHQVCSIFTQEKFIHLRSTINATCSYGKTSSFLRYHDEENSVDQAKIRAWRRRCKSGEGPDRECDTPSPQPAGHSGVVYPNSPQQRPSCQPPRNTKFQKYLFNRNKILPSYVPLCINDRSNSSIYSDYEIRVVPTNQILQDVGELLDSLNSTQSTYNSVGNSGEEENFFSGASNINGDSPQSVGSRDSGKSNEQTDLDGGADESFSNTIIHHQDTKISNHPKSLDDDDYRRNSHQIDDQRVSSHRNDDDNNVDDDDDDHREVVASYRQLESNAGWTRPSGSQPIGRERHIAPPSQRAPPQFRNEFEMLSHSDTESSMITSTPKKSQKTRTKSLSPKRSRSSKQQSSIRLRIERPEFLITDSVLKSSGTPQQMGAQLPYKQSLRSSKTTTSKTKSRVGKS